jgi:hypothetical protein
LLAVESGTSQEKDELLVDSSQNITEITEK